MERPHTAEDYADLFGEDLVLVGGQAVNFWAELFLPYEPALQQYLPFTSRDADFYRKGRRFRIPQGWKEVEQPSKGRMRLVSHALVGPAQQEAEIIRSVNGLSKDEIEMGILPVNYAGSDILILNPVLLFKAKATNVRSLDQKARQDVKHLKILIIVVRRFIQSLLEESNTPERPKGTIALMNVHMESVRAAHCLEPLRGVNWDSYFPLGVMEAHASSAVNNFHKRLLETKLIDKHGSREGAKNDADLP